MRDDSPSPENASPGSRGARAGAPEDMRSESMPPWQGMGEAWTSIMTAWADLTMGWASLMTAWMRASGSWMGMNPMMGTNPFRAGTQAAASWARQAMDCAARASRNVQPPTATGASAAPVKPPVVTPPPAPVRPHEEPSAALARARPHAPPARRASEDHVRGIIAHRGDTSDDIPPLADGT